MKSIKTLFLLVAIIFSANTYSQKKKSNENIKLTILVKDSKNNPVPGAVILLDDIKQKRIANKAGFFKIKLKNAPKVITAFSPLIGVKKVKYTGKNSIIINLANDNDNFLSDSNNEKMVDPIQFRDIYDYLRGKVAGLNVSTTNTIRIRGASSWGGGKAPLLVLNGMQIDNDTFGDIVPTTIRSIKVLKGPETSIYGLRGANGVIEVYTTIN